MGITIVLGSQWGDEGKKERLWDWVGSEIWGVFGVMDHGCISGRGRGHGHGNRYTCN